MGTSWNIYCDLDGVLADFDKGISNIFDGKKPEQLNREEMHSFRNQRDHPLANSIIFFTLPFNEFSSSSLGVALKILYISWHSKG